MDQREAMERAIALAWRGWGRVGTNPMVGAVLMRDGRVVSEGYHAEFGGPHGEAVALAAAGEAARGADLVVTLEPCRHSGKTPPCARAIIDAGVRRVVFGAADADPQAAGGAEVLRSGGVNVESGLLEQDVARQNAVFFRRHDGGARPFVALKLAVSLDARIADSGGRSRWVSGPEARAYVHWLRAGFDALAVAAGTVRTDDPSLTVRGEVVPARPPLRVIFDDRAETPPEAVMVATAREVPTLVFVGHAAEAEPVAKLREAGTDVARSDGLAEALEALRARGVAGLLVEGGGVLAGRLLEEDLVDRLYIVTAPLFLGPSGVPAFGEFRGSDLDDATRWRPWDRRSLGDDSLAVMERA